MIEKTFETPKEGEPENEAEYKQTETPESKKPPELEEKLDIPKTDEEVAEWLDGAEPELNEMEEKVLAMKEELGAETEEEKIGQEFLKTEDEAIKAAVAVSVNEKEREKKESRGRVAKAITVFAAAAVFATFLATQPGKAKAESYYPGKGKAEYSSRVRHLPPPPPVGVIIHEGSKIFQRQQELRRLEIKEVGARLQQALHRIQWVEQSVQLIKNRLDLAGGREKNPRIDSQLNRIEEQQNQIIMILEQIQSQRR